MRSSNRVMFPVAALLGFGLALSGCAHPPRTAGAAGISGAADTSGAPSATPIPALTASPLWGDPVTGPIVRTKGCATATSTPSQLGNTGQLANMDKLMKLYERLDPAARSRFGSVYVETRLALMRDRIQVYRVPSTQFDRWVLDTFAADCVEVLDAKFSAAQAAAWEQRIVNDIESGYWKQRGIGVASVSHDVARGVVVVGVLDHLDQARVAVPSRYPGVPIEVKQDYPARFD
jgi:hypothetical protein